MLAERFVSERSVNCKDKGVLAPVWEFVNHSSFASPLRITPLGMETPPIEPRSEEILIKYSGKNSPMSMWKKYGFACECIVAYSIPFSINIANQALDIRCSGQLGLDPKEKQPSLRTAMFFRLSRCLLRVCLILFRGKT